MPAKKAKPHLKKQQVNVKLPRWLIEWTEKQPQSRALLIELAMRRTYKIDPPE